MKEQDTDKKYTMETVIHKTMDEVLIPDKAPSGVSQNEIYGATIIASVHLVHKNKIYTSYNVFIKRQNVNTFRNQHHNPYCFTIEYIGGMKGKDAGHTLEGNYNSAIKAAQNLVETKIAELESIETQKEYLASRAVCKSKSGLFRCYKNDDSLYIRYMITRTPKYNGQMVDNIAEILDNGEIRGVTGNSGDRFLKLSDIEKCDIITIALQLYRSKLISMDFKNVSKHFFQALKLLFARILFKLTSKQ